MRLSDFAQINPKVTLKKGADNPCVMMEDITPGSRYVSAKGKRAYRGGAVFETGDTLFARITPCLENGKISQFLGSPGASAFGSTEFIVFRHRPGVSDPGYVYYLACSDIVRKPAEKSMFGASGRQRADLEVIKNIEVLPRPLPTQEKIAATLGTYDDLIQNNTRRIKILEEMAQAIYREWFVHFRFPGHEKAKFVDSPLGKIPGGWEVKKLAEVCKVVMGQSPKSEFYNQSGEGLPFHQGVTDFGERFPADRVYCTVQNRLAEPGDILFSVRAPVGRMNISITKIVIGRGLCAIGSRKGHQCFVFQQLKEKFQEEDTMGGGTIFKAVTKEDVHGMLFMQTPPQIVDQFEAVVKPMFFQLENLTRKNANLRSTRDLLLPKLISGELDVSNLDIQVGEASP